MHAAGFKDVPETICGNTNLERIYGCTLLDSRAI
jgi:hypothetical protein